MLRIAVCDDSRTDVEVLEAAFDELPDYPVEYDVYFSGKELLMCSMQDKENYHLYIFDNRDINIKKIFMHLMSFLIVKIQLISLYLKFR